MTSEARPAVFRIITTNYVTFLSVIAPLFLAIFFLLDYLRGDMPGQDDLRLLGGFLVIGGGVALWKIISISALIRHGQETTAVIYSTGYFQGRGVIRFVYTYQGEKYLNQNIVLKTKHTSIYPDGSEVQVFVNPNDPRKAIVKDIYSK